MWKRVGESADPGLDGTSQVRWIHRPGIAPTYLYECHAATWRCALTGLAWIRAADLSGPLPVGPTRRQKLTLRVTS